MKTALQMIAYFLVVALLFWGCEQLNGGPPPPCQGYGCESYENPYEGW